MRTLMAKTPDAPWVTLVSQAHPSFYPEDEFEAELRAMRATGLGAEEVAGDEEVEAEAGKVVAGDEGGVGGQGADVGDDGAGDGEQRCPGRGGGAGDEDVPGLQPVGVGGFEDDPDGAGGASGAGALPGGERRPAPTGQASVSARSVHLIRMALPLVMGPEALP